jgi:hypothetical protein
MKEGQSLFLDLGTVPFPRLGDCPFRDCPSLLDLVDLGTVPKIRLLSIRTGDAFAPFLGPLG